MSYNNNRIENIKHICPFCLGKGQDPTSIEFSKCPTCLGRGYNLIPENWTNCIDCNATGRISMNDSLPLGDIGILGPAYKSCPMCSGKGFRLSGPSVTATKSSEETKMTNEQKIIDFLNNNRHKSFDDDQLGELLDIDRHQVNKICNELIEKGRITRINKLHNRIT